MQYGLSTPGARFRAIAYPTGFFHWVFFFSLGAVCFLHHQRAKLLLGRFKWQLLISVIMLATLQLAVVFRAEFPLDPARFDSFTFSSTFYALAFILCFLAFDKVRIPFASALRWLGTRSYAIYLIHFTAQVAISKLIYLFAPFLLKYQIVYQPVLIVGSIGVPLLFMQLIARSPLKKYYHFLFGTTLRAPLRRRSTLARDEDVATRPEPLRLSAPRTGH
jgi:peptidoglycan/LPS O-acetylase OafA/YrhL